MAPHQSGATALYMASVNNRDKVVETLIDAGANVNSQYQVCQHPEFCFLSEAAFVIKLTLDNPRTGQHHW